ncbi:hypothetical protein CCHOA_08660 [Corynebacterium choanae]|uniref:Uncharacterized protein n=1 Tax=Corynebacterium choanae TaxID=1862358 RepID=A0A3G6J7M9_9CORY|nr:hypothetical protein CCHOA_08660 [Corynebacterium choanae]
MTSPIFPADDRNRFDVDVPKRAEGTLPTIVWGHGGAVVAGTKEGSEHYAVMLAHEGHTVVRAEYQGPGDHLTQSSLAGGRSTRRVACCGR